MTEEDPARGGELDPPCLPLEQLRAQFALELRHVMGDGRLCVAKRLRRLGERAEAGYLTEDLEPGQFKHR